MNEHDKTHIARVGVWVDENVQHFATPSTVTLHSFEIDWADLIGSFRVRLDDHELAGKFDFDMDQAGRPDFNAPMLTSPLGAPASYPAVKLCEATTAAILEGLRQTVPAIAPCGLNQKTGRKVFFTSPVHERILDAEAFEAARSRVTHSYSITVETRPRT